MKKAQPAKHAAKDEMRPHYDIPWNLAVRGKYAGRNKRESYFVAIDPELKELFPNADAVNDALHQLARAIRAAAAGTARKSA